jgi:hypothetical protein
MWIVASGAQTSKLTCCLCIPGGRLQILCAPVQFTDAASASAFAEHVMQIISKAFCHVMVSEPSELKVCARHVALDWCMFGTECAFASTAAARKLAECTETLLFAVR